MNGKTLAGKSAHHKVETIYTVGSFRIEMYNC
jgi:hypothetical protein